MEGQAREGWWALMANGGTVSNTILWVMLQLQGKGTFKDNRRSVFVFVFLLFKNRENAVRTPPLKYVSGHAHSLACGLTPAHAPHPRLISWQWRCGEGKWHSSGIWALDQHAWNFQTSQLMTTSGTASM